MTRHTPRVLLVNAVLLTSATWATANELHGWLRFRGPNGTGVSRSVGLPDAISLDENVIWKTDAGAGSSSPIVVDDRLIVTSYEGDQRIVGCFDSASGEALWSKSINKVRDETASNPNSPATCTPATDGRYVVAFFPDAGLVCYSLEGEEQWKVEVGPFHSMHGIAGSPILVDDLVILVVDQLQESQLRGYSLETGELAWSCPRVNGLTGAYSTPSAVESEDGAVLVVTNGPQEVSAYVAATGEKVWSVPGISNAPISLPVVDGGRLFVCEPVGTAAPISMLAPMDKNKDGKYSLEEAQVSLPMYRLLERIDLDHGNGDGVVEEPEWDAAFGGFLNKGGLVAVDLNAEDVSIAPEVSWSYRKSVPYVASPLAYDGIVYLVQDGGIVTAIASENGEVLKRGRLRRGSKKYYASPVAADGKIYLLDTAGQLTVIRAGGQWEEISTVSLGEPCFATPAIAAGRLYVRTAKTLFCLGAAR